MADDKFETALAAFSSCSPKLCPIKLEDMSYPIVGCSFSSATFVMDYFADERLCNMAKGMFIKDLFKKGLNLLRSSPVSANAQPAVQRLKDYLSHTSQSAITKLNEECKAETQFNCMVATEVLIPLSSGCCVINRKPPGFKNERLVLPSEYGVKGLVIGFSHGYYGEADIVVVPKSEPEQGTVLVSAESEESVTKRTRTDEGGNSPSEDTSPGKAIVEGKNVSQDSLSAMSQCVATIITFARIQGDRHTDFPCPFPMLRVNPSGVVVLVYDYPNDVLMISELVPWNDFAFITVWLVLHFSLFRPDSLGHLSNCCCGYRTASDGVSMGTQWYLESPAVFSQPRKKLFRFQGIVA